MAPLFGERVQHHLEAVLLGASHVAATSTVAAQVGGSLAAYPSPRSGQSSPPLHADASSITP
jgi:hypothetical protein